MPQPELTVSHIYIYIRTRSGSRPTPSCDSLDRSSALVYAEASQITSTTTSPRVSQSVNQSKRKKMAMTKRDFNNLDWAQRAVERYTDDHCSDFPDFAYPVQYFMYAPDLDGVVHIEVPEKWIDVSTFRSAFSSFLADVLIRDARHGHPVYDSFGVIFRVKQLFDQPVPPRL